MMRALLDVNVLIALLDAHHVHHRSAMAWLEKNFHHGWASCPITQNGCVRILSQSAYPNRAPAAEIAVRLAEACAESAHAFWADDISIVPAGALDWQRLITARHLTDAYLLSLAVHRQGRFVTLDRNIPLEAVPGASSQHLAIIG
jgi:toxin-antitoxin system PIN domain toxin